MKVASIALGLLALAAVSSAITCGVGSSTSTCTQTDLPATVANMCYSCALPNGGTFAGGCDTSVTSGPTSCTYAKTTVTALYSGCTW
jgi:hypothetical protein